MEELDLEINNYNLNDILELFNLSLNCELTEQELKYAKQKVLKSHPDKSKLDAKYFIFYQKAYNKLYSVYTFKNKSKMKIGSNIDGFLNDNNKILLDNFFKKNEKLKKNDYFNKWFNKEFERNKIENEYDSGYGSWLKSSDDIIDKKCSSLASMNEEIMKRKKEIRSLIVHNDINDMYYTKQINSTELSGKQPEDYSSSLFSNLQYQDLKKAHVESVIGVTDEDYHSKQKFNNINEFISQRDLQDTTPLSERQALSYLNKKAELEDYDANITAYNLAKQTEKVEQNNKTFWSKLMNIK